MSATPEKQTQTSWAAFWAVRRTAKHSIPKWQLPPGFPLVVDLSNGAVCEPALLFLYYRHVKSRAKKSVPNTLDAYADDLKEWFRHLEEFQIAWNEICPEDVVAFMKVMRATISPETGKSYATRTVNRRASTVISFYRWAIRSTFKDIFSDEVRKLLDNISHRRRDFTLELEADEQQHVSLIQPDAARRISASAGARPSEIAASDYLDRCKNIENKSALADSKSSRDRLSIELALQTGLRISEVCALRKLTFQNFATQRRLPDTQIIKISVKGKGGKKREVDFSGALINEIADYLIGERAGILELTGIKDPAALLLNPISAGRHAGEQTSVRTLERAFANACKKAGLSRQTQICTFNEQGHVSGSRTIICPSFVFHDLRHTFAIWTYYSRKKNGDPEPWLYIQQQLGHSFLETTLKIYLAAAQDFEAEVSDMYMAVLNG